VAGSVSVQAPRLLVHAGHHGVALYSRRLAAAVVAVDPKTIVLPIDRVDEVGEGQGVHVHFTDRLWAETPAEAARRVAALARRHALSVTLHDVPQDSDGERNLRRRSTAYATVARLAERIFVNSDHEKDLLATHGVWGGEAEVIVLPVDVEKTSRVAEQDDAVGVLGFFYPGKGHDEASRAAADAGLHRLVVLGRASDGHAADLAAFVRRAAAAGVDVEVTGWLADDALVARARSTSVPVLTHRHLSASGSLATWIGAGRRPLALEGRYVDEMAHLRPGTVQTVRLENLSDAVRAAWRDPGSTWHGLASVPKSTTDVAEDYLRSWRRMP
jgi:glycosyltransferase involved in cell wall biosynthesis